MKRLAVINVVGLTADLIDRGMPRISSLKQSGGICSVDPALPAVTCTAQSNYLTGLTPSQHGIVANGWYNRDLAEVQFWKQPNQLVQAPKVWDRLKASIPGFTCAKVFWWYNMYTSTDYSLTPRPMYPADGRKVFDIYTWPYDIRPEVKKELGPFPFPTFWGPAAGMNTPQGPPQAVSQWIADSARWVEKQYQPSLNLVYLPHLDYNLQRYGPDHPCIPEDLARIDTIVGDLVDFLENRGVGSLVLSEYGITPVRKPIHLNRLFREQGWLTIKEELGRELIDFGASKVFAVADHQVAHVHVQDSSQLSEVRRLLESTEGVNWVWGTDEKKDNGLDHERAGDLVVFSKDWAWFTYYYWLQDDRAPDFARCVDIHRKPGYDPVELFLDPSLTFPKLKIAWRLLQKKLGFRMLMDVIPLDAGLIKGSHGTRPEDKRHYPVLLSGNAAWLPDQDSIDSTEVASCIEAFFERT
jgi:predicted AlkP superfamily pyrophosphatase or phosphodiesterase